MKKNYYIHSKIKKKQFKATNIIIKMKNICES